MKTVTGVMGIRVVQGASKIDCEGSDYPTGKCDLCKIHPTPGVPSKPCPIRLWNPTRLIVQTNSGDDVELILEPGAWSAIPVTIEQEGDFDED